MCIRDRGGRKLIDQTADAQVFIADDRLFVVEYAADFDGHLRFLKGLGNVLELGRNRADTDDALDEQFGIERVFDGFRTLDELLDVAVGLDFLDHNDVAPVSYTHLPYLR